MKTRVEVLEVVRNYVRGGFGDLPVRPTTRGTKHNFFVGEGPDFVMKVGHKNTLAAQKFALERYGESGIPAPEIIYLDLDYSSGNEGLLVLKYVPNDGEGSVYNLRKMGALLRNMHQVCIEGVGKLDVGQGKGVSINWREFLEEKASWNRESVREALGTDPVEFIGETPESIGNSLLHLDYAKPNILIGGKDIVAVIDPMPAIGDPMLDLAFAFMRFTEDEKIDFINGYSPEGFSADENHRLNVYNRVATLNKLGFLLQQLENPDVTEVAREDYRTRIEKYISFLKGTNPK